MQIGVISSSNPEKLEKALLNGLVLKARQLEKLPNLSNDREQKDHEPCPLLLYVTYSCANCIKTESAIGTSNLSD